MRRILFITSTKLSFRRAHARNIIKTAASLMRAGMQVRILTSAGETDVERLLEMHGVAKILSKENIILTSSLLRGLLRERQSFDFLYARDPKLIFPVLMARLFLKKKIIFEIHGNKEWKFLTPLWLLMYRLAHGVVFITKRLQSWYGNTRPSIVVHMNAPDFEIFEANKKNKKALCEELFLPPNATVLLYAGSVLWNRVEILIETLPLLPTGTILVLLGLKEDEEVRMRLIAKKLHVEERLRMKARVDPVDVPRYLMAADLLLIPPGSIAYEGSMASKIFDYLAAGVPIVSHVHGANKEVLSHKRNALLVETSDPADFAREIRRLGEQPDLGVRIAHQAEIDARQYTWEGRGEAIKNLLKRVADDE